MPDTFPHMAELAPAVAAQLGPEWSTHRNSAEGNHDPSCNLRHRDGRTVELTLITSEHSSERGRLYASCVLPETPEDVEPATSDIKRGHITIAGTKAPQQIARDITRRLLPIVTTAHAQYHARVDRLRADEAARKTAADQLATVPGLSHSARPHTDLAWHLSWTGTPGQTSEDSSARWRNTPSARVTVDAPDSTERVDIALSGLSADQAERVLHALTTN